MPIKRRGYRWQVDFQHAGQRVRQSFLVEDEAKQYLAALQAAADRGADIAGVVRQDAPACTLQDLYAAAAPRLWDGSKNERHAKRNALDIITILGPRTDPNRLTAASIDAAVTAMTQQGNSPSTINRKLSALSKMLKWGHRREMVEKVPPIDRLREPSGRERYYTPEEEARIVHYLQHHPALEMRAMADLVIFLADTGCRVGEAIKMLSEDIRPPLVVFQDTKNGTTRAVPMTARVRALMASRESPNNPRARVFPEWQDNRHTARVWDIARQHLKLGPECVLHTWRHTCASRLIQRGAPIASVQAWMGHKSIHTTLRYAHLAPDSLDAIKGLLECVTPASQATPGVTVTRA